MLVNREREMFTQLWDTAQVRIADAHMQGYREGEQAAQKASVTAMHRSILLRMFSP